MGTFHPGSARDTVRVRQNCGRGEDSAAIGGRTSVNTTVLIAADWRPGDSLPGASRTPTSEWRVFVPNPGQLMWGRPRDVVFPCSGLYAVVPRSECHGCDEAARDVLRQLAGFPVFPTLKRGSSRCLILKSMFRLVQEAKGIHYFHSEPVTPLLDHANSIAGGRLLASPCLGPERSVTSEILRISHLVSLRLDNGSARGHLTIVSETFGVSDHLRIRRHRDYLSNRRRYYAGWRSRRRSGPAGRSLIAPVPLPDLKF
jgi:hypothetical protein